MMNAEGGKRKVLILNKHKLTDYLFALFDIVTVLVCNLSYRYRLICVPFENTLVCGEYANRNMTSYFSLPLEALLSQFGIRSVVPFNTEEQSVLNAEYERNPYPTKEDRERIAMNLGHTFKKIDSWFLQKRFKMNRAKGCRK